MLESKTQAGYYLLKIKFNQKGFEKKDWILYYARDSKWILRKTGIPEEGYRVKIIRKK